MRLWPFAAALLTLCVGCGAPEPSVDVDPVVAARLDLDFTARCDVLRAGGVPEAISDLPEWCPVPPAGQNAAHYYAESFIIEDPQARLRALLHAGSIPEYAFPVDWQQQNTTLMVPFKVTEGFLDAALFLGLATHHAVLQGDDQQALLALLAGYSMTRHTASDPFLINQTARVSCQRALTDALVYALRHLEFDDQQLLDLQETVRVAHRPEALPRAWFVERTLSEGKDPFGKDHAPEQVEEALGLVQLRIAWTVIAVERHIRANGAAPATLDALVPGLLEQVPEDIFSGVALRYAKDKAGYVVYSIGAMGTGGGEGVPLEAYDSAHRRAIYLPYGKRPPEGMPAGAPGGSAQDAQPVAMLQ